MYVGASFGCWGFVQYLFVFMIKIKALHKCIVPLHFISSPKPPPLPPPRPPCGRPQAPLLLGRGGGWLGSPVPNSRGVVGGWLEQGCTPQTLPDSCLSCNVQHRYWVAPDHATQFCVTYFFHFYTRRRKTKYFEKFKCSFLPGKWQVKFYKNDDFTKSTILQNRRFCKIVVFVKLQFYKKHDFTKSSILQNRRFHKIDDFTKSTIL